MELGSSHRYLVGPGELAQAAAEGGAAKGKSLSRVWSVWGGSAFLVLSAGTNLHSKYLPNTPYSYRPGLGLRQ